MTPSSVVAIPIYFFSSSRRHTRFSRDWSSDVCSSDLLVNRRDTELEGGGRRVDGDDLAVPPDLPGVRLVRTGQDLDEGGLAGAVLPEQAVHLAGTDLEVHAVEGLGAGEVLDDAGEIGRAHV